MDISRVASDHFVHCFRFVETVFAFLQFFGFTGFVWFVWLVETFFLYSMFDDLMEMKS